MHVSGVFLPLVTACMGVSAYSAQHHDKGEKGCAGPRDTVYPAAASAGQAAGCLHLAGAACKGVRAPRMLPAPRCCLLFECAVMDLHDVVGAGVSHPCSHLTPPAQSQG